MYEMKPEYFTGIDFIDKEHARLSLLPMKLTNY